MAQGYYSNAPPSAFQAGPTTQWDQRNRYGNDYYTANPPATAYQRNPPPGAFSYSAAPPQDTTSNQRNQPPPIAPKPRIATAPYSPEVQPNYSTDYRGLPRVGNESYGKQFNGQPPYGEVPPQRPAEYGNFSPGVYSNRFDQRDSPYGMYDDVAYPQPAKPTDAPYNYGRMYDAPLDQYENRRGNSQRTEDQFKRSDNADNKRNDRYRKPGESVVNEQRGVEVAQRKSGDAFQRPNDSQLRSPDVYPRAYDSYQKAADSYPNSAVYPQRSSDPYPRSSDPYPRSSDPYPRSSDPYPRSSDPRLSDPYQKKRIESYEREDSNVRRNDFFYGNGYNQRDRKDDETSSKTSVHRGYEWSGSLRRTYEFDKYSDDTDTDPIRAESLQRFSSVTEKPKSPGVFEGPSYDLDHLATFSFGVQTGIRNKDDALNKLAMMSLHGGIWTMRMRLVVGKEQLVIIDAATEKVIAKLLLNTIEDCSTTDMSKLSGSSFNNLILLSVCDPDNRPDELHVFQCIGKSAKLLCNDIDDAKAGILKIPYRVQKIPPDVTPRTFIPPTSPPPELPARTLKPEVPEAPVSLPVEYDDHYSTVPVDQPNMPPAFAPKPNVVMERQPSVASKMDAIVVVERVPPTPTNNEEAAPIVFPLPPPQQAKPVEEPVTEQQPKPISEPSIADFPYDDITDDEKRNRTKKLIDLLFTDIEKFLEWLQNASKAREELEKSKDKKAKKKKDKKELERLKKQAVGPEVKDFIDILQKFKITFIVLPLMKDYMADVKPAEQIHELFSLLKIIVESSRDPNRPEVSLVSHTSVPAMTTGSISLLESCLNAEEATLWKSFGDAWTKSRSMLPAEKLEGYVPRFSNNTQPSEGCLGDWSPIIFGTADWPKPVVIVPPPASKANTVASRKSDIWAKYDEDSLPKPDYVVETRRLETQVSTTQEETLKDIDNIEWISEQKKYQRKLQIRNARICQAKLDRRAQKRDELDILKAEIFEVLDYSENDWRLRNSQGVVGYVPAAFLGDTERI